MLVRQIDSCFPTSVKSIAYITVVNKIHLFSSMYDYHLSTTELSLTMYLIGMHISSKCNFYLCTSSGLISSQGKPAGISKLHKIVKSLNMYLCIYFEH